MNNSLANNNTVRLGAAVLICGLVLYLIWPATPSSDSKRPPSDSITTTPKTVKHSKKPSIGGDKDKDVKDDDEQDVEDDTEVVELSFVKTTVVASEATVGQMDAAVEVTEPAKQALSTEKKEVEAETTIGSQADSARDVALSSSEEEEVVIVSRELQLPGESIERMQATTVQEHKIREDEQTTVETHSEVKVQDIVASDKTIEEFAEQIQAVVVEEDQPQFEMDQSFIQVESSQAFLERVEIATVAKTERQEEEEEEEEEQVQEQEQEQKKESGESELKIEESTIEVRHSDFEVEEQEEAVAEISISTSATNATTATTTTTTEAMEQHTIRSFGEQQAVEEAEEAEDTLALDEQKAAEVDAMVNDDQDQVHKDVRVDTTFFHAAARDSLLSPKKSSSEEFPGQREAAERIDKALAIAEAASPYSSVKLIAPSPSSPSTSETSSSPSLASSTTVTTEEPQYPVNGQANGIQKPTPRYTLNTDAAVFTPSWLPKPTTPESRSSIFSAQDSSSMQSSIWTSPQPTEVQQQQPPRESTPQDTNRAKMKSRCRFWPNCTNKACKFTHPSLPCRDPDNCSFGDRCIFIHPKDLNRQASRGKRAAGGAGAGNGNGNGNGNGAGAGSTGGNATTAQAGAGSGSAWPQPRRQNRNAPVNGSS
ncbi:hypothetical protein BGX31_005897 [Mortierella sp. GBA43]|nr:hypothetical protein BGX31_005897 [Mortierella sp. GBA43]